MLKLKEKLKILGQIGTKTQLINWLMSVDLVDEWCIERCI